MSETLVARWRSERVEWIPMDARGGKLGPVQSGDPAELQANVANRRLVFVVPGEEVLVTQVDIPVKGASKVLKAVPFALEEQLVGDVDGQHFAISRKSGDNRYGVAIVSRETIDGWMAKLAEQGLEPDELVPESLGVPWHDEQSTLLLADGEIAIRNGQWDTACLGGLSIDEAADCMSPDVSQTLAVFCGVSDFDQQSVQIEALRERYEESTLSLLDEGGLPVLASQILSGDRINLLQGQYSQGSRLSEQFGPWKIAASLLLAFLVTLFARDIALLQQLKRSDAQQRQEMAALLRSVCPQETRAIDPLGQLRTCTNSVGDDEQQQFLLALEMLTNALPAGANAELISINYASRTMELRLSVPDVATLDGIQRKVSEAPGYAAEIQSATRVDGATEGRIQIRHVEGQA